MDDYRKKNVDEKQKFIKEKISKLPVHQLMKQIKSDELLWDFGAVSLYPSAMWDENRLYPILETGYAFTNDMNEKLVESFISQTFTQGSATLKIKYYNPKILIVQHIPVKEKSY